MSKRKQRIRRDSAITRARLNRFREEQQLSPKETAELMDIPYPTMTAWCRPLSAPNAKYPRVTMLEKINNKLDDLGAPKGKSENGFAECAEAKREGDRHVVARTFVGSMPAPNRAAVQPVKPTTTERELRWLVEGYRSEAIQGITDEARYIVERYRKEVDAHEQPSSHEG